MNANSTNEQHFVTFVRIRVFREKQLTVQVVGTFLVILGSYDLMQHPFG